MKTKFLKFTSKMMFLILILTISLTCSSCVFGWGMYSSGWSVYDHQSFVEKIEEFNSKHNAYVDTFISFDLDSNEEILEKYYYFQAVSSSKQSKDTPYDKYTNHFHEVVILFYLSGYKIEYKSQTGLSGNFTDKAEFDIKSGGKHGMDCKEDALYYQDSDNSKKIYNYAYYYKLYVNDVEFGCVHISSVDEPSEEKLNELLQMMEDSLVVINTEKFFIWRKLK